MFWSTQTKLKGLTPAIGASPNFVLPQKVLSDSNKKISKDIGLWREVENFFKGRGWGMGKFSYFCGVKMFYHVTET